jgi:RNA polymerase sigma factor (TIGR02999 family)
MSDETARLLAGVAQGDRQSTEALMAYVNAELRAVAAKMMHSERPGHTLQPTALVNEAYFRMMDQKNVNWRDKSHFCAVAANLMRRILIDYARKRSAGKRGGRARSLILDEELLLSDETDPLDLIALDDVLNELGRLNQRHARIVELRYFSGLSIEETAEVIGVSPATVKNDWRVARAWLTTQLSMEGSS